MRENKDESDSSRPRTLSLHFQGPFKFNKGENYLYDSAFTSYEGIYIWTIKDDISGKNFVHYIGQTKGLGKRHKEHLIQITGLNYRIIDADLARQGIEYVLWNGMWRDRSKDAVASLLQNYASVSSKVIDYINLINVYFAPTNLDNSLRKHIEGCLGLNFRSNYPHLKTFYPDDNRIGRKSYNLGIKLLLKIPEAISGIDLEQEI